MNNTVSRKELLSSSITNLRHNSGHDLAIEIVNALNYTGIHTVGQLVQMRVAHVKKIDRIGKSAFAELQNVLSDHGLCFDMALTQEELVSLRALEAVAKVYLRADDTFMPTVPLTIKYHKTRYKPAAEIDWFQITKGEIAPIQIGIFATGTDRYPVYIDPKSQDIWYDLMVKL